jgi:hypothetical protein
MGRLRLVNAHASRAWAPHTRACALAFAVFALTACRAAAAPGPTASAPASAPAASDADATRPAAPGVSASAASAPSPPSASATAAAPVGSASVAPVPRYASTAFSTKSDPAFRGCHASFRAAGKDVARNVAAIAGGCAKATRMKPVASVIVAEQSDGQPPQSYPFKATSHRCYRVYVQASTSVLDFDVAIRDSTGAILDQHAAGASGAVLPEDGAACFAVDDTASVVFSVGRGGGAYALQIWGD